MRAGWWVGRHGERGLGPRMPETSQHATTLLDVSLEGHGVRHVGVIVFGQNVQKSSIDGGFRVIKFGDVSMLDPVH